MVDAVPLPGIAAEVGISGLRSSSLRAKSDYVKPLNHFASARQPAWILALKINWFYWTISLWFFFFFLLTCPSSSVGCRRWGCMDEFLPFLPVFDTLCYLSCITSSSNPFGAPRVFCLFICRQPDWLPPNRKDRRFRRWIAWISEMLFCK